MQYFHRGFSAFLFGMTDVLVWHLSCMTHHMSVGDPDWCRLAELVLTEHDPARLSRLIEQLLKALESRKEELGTRHLDQTSSEIDSTKPLRKACLSDELLDWDAV
jgi:hypothetical protein